jgi:hypothetical protein
MANISFECPKCNQPLDAPQELATRFIECATCKEVIEVPARSESTKPPVPPPFAPSPAPPKTQVADPSQGAVSASALAVCFTVFAAISFGAAGLAIFLLSSDNRIDNQQGAVLLPAGISGGLFCLAVAKIIRCLHESSQRLQRIEKLLERR